MLVRRLDTRHDMTFGHGFANMATEEEAVAQRVKTRLLLLFNEWFLDISDGVPYLPDVMKRPSNLPLAESIIKKRIIETEGVEELREFSMTLDRETRRLTIQAVATNIYGTTTNIRV